MIESVSEVTPPRPALALTIGIIGQLQANENAMNCAAEILSTIHTKVFGLNSRPWFRLGNPDVRTLTTLATDTDHQLANIAIKSGFALDVALPIVGSASSATHTYHQLHLACDRESSETLLFQAIVAHSSLILAVWNGKGRCSVAETVATAIDAGIPVIQVPIDGREPARLLWSGITTLPSTQSDFDGVTAEPCTPDAIAAMLTTILLPPDDSEERAQLQQFFDEPLYRRNLRFAYPMLLAATGTQKWRTKAWNKALYLPEMKLEWGGFKTAGGDHWQENAAMLAILEESFLWANHLGSHFAQTMRSALVANFSLSALAVLVALAGLASTAFKLPLALTEIVIIAAVIINIRRGSREGWHRRWLDYRSIAERLRPFRSLKLLGIAQQPRRIQRKGSSPRRWIDWYVEAIWQEMGTPQGTVDANQLNRLRSLVADSELAGEIAYHRTNARRMRHLEVRLHLVGNCSFLATILVCALFPILYFGSYELAMAWSNGFVMLSAGLPAIGGASYALRVHGDYAGAAGRSLETAAALDGIRTAVLAQDGSLARVAALTTAAARVMLVDLDEWQMTYAQRSLAIPS